jgi:hypothetical protein
MLSLGMQLAQIGLLVQLSELDAEYAVDWSTHEVPNGRRPTQAQIKKLAARAAQGRWLVEPRQSPHPFWRRIGRRQPDVGSQRAHAVLAGLSAEQRIAELVDLVDQHLWPPADGPLGYARHIVLPEPYEGQYRAGAGGGWGQGTIFPETIPQPALSSLGTRISAWAVALAWEAQHWLGADCWRAPGGGAALPLPMIPIALGKLGRMYRSAYLLAGLLAAENCGPSYAEPALMELGIEQPAGRPMGWGAHRILWCRYEWRQSNPHYAEFYPLEYQVGNQRVHIGMAG